MKITIEFEVRAPSLCADNIGLVAEHVGRSIQAHGYTEGEVDRATLPDNTQACYRVWLEGHR